MTKEEEIEILKTIVKYDIVKVNYNDISIPWIFEIKNGNFKIYEYLVKKDKIVLNKENYKILNFKLTCEEYEEMKEKIIQYEKEIIDEFIKPEKKVEKKKNKKRL